MRLALSRIAWATPFHFFSWSGVILSAAFSVVMRCSTVSGLLEVAASAAGGLVACSLVWARTGIANSAAPATLAIATGRVTLKNREWVMRTPLPVSGQMAAQGENEAFVVGVAAHFAAQEGNRLGFDTSP